MISIIIPAFNEASVIEESLRCLLEGAKDGEFEVWVVCNGCTDDTEAIARSIGDPVQVLSTPTASKVAALNLGDEHATGFPRFYVDADVRIASAAVRQVASILENGRALAAAPRVEIDLDHASRLVHSYYAVWQTLPYFDDSMIGSGVYALSEAGRARFERFPPIIADDEFVRRLFAPNERRSIAGARFKIRSPKRVRGVLREKTRSRLGVYQLDRTFDSPSWRPSLLRRIAAAARAVAGVPAVWVDVPVYACVTLIARARAALRVLRSDYAGWERDESSRPSREN